MLSLFHEIILPICIISAIVFVWWLCSFIVYRSYRQLTTRGTTVQAVITEVEKSKVVFGIKFHHETPRFQYRFLTGFGTEIMSGKKDIPLLMRSREEQDVIPILYLADRPEINHMAENVKLHVRGLYFWTFVPLVGWLILVTPLIAGVLLNQ